MKWNSRDKHRLASGWEARIRRSERNGKKRDREKRKKEMEMESVIVFVPDLGLLLIRF